MKSATYKFVGGVIKDFFRTSYLIYFLIKVWAI
jgi:hypothetical protein